MIRFGADAGRVALRGTSGDTSFETDVVLTHSESRRTTLNGERLGSAEQLRHELSDARLHAGQAGRRQGRPGDATRVPRSHGRAGCSLPERELASDYAGALGQRNAALRRIRAGHSTRDALVPWTERTVALGQELVRARTDAVEILSPARSPTLPTRWGSPTRSLEYEGEPATVDDLDARLDADSIAGSRVPDHTSTTCASRPAGRDLRMFGSQGEQRVAVLSLVLAGDGGAAEPDRRHPARAARRRPLGARRRPPKRLSRI